MSRNRFAALAAATLALGLLAAPSARAQDAPADDALDRLLEKVEGAKPEDKPAPDAKADADKPKPSGDKKADADKPSDPKAKADEKAKPKDEKKPDGEAKPEDEALDRLLQGIGETEDAPEAQGKPQGGQPGEGDKPPVPGGPDDLTAEKLDDREKQIDAELERILGRRKKNPRDDQDQQQSGGPLGEAIKKMDDVEKKLGEQDTGEKTRQEQQEIVKSIETLIKQAQRGQGRSRGQRSVQQAGNRPGQQQGQQNPNGNTAQGVGPQVPKRPDAKQTLTQNKDTWGNLPDQMRAEIESTFSEDGLPSRKSLIDRYFLSVSRKSTARDQ